MTDQRLVYEEQDDSSYLNRNSKNQNVKRTRQVYTYKGL